MHASIGPYWESFDRGTMEYADAARRLVGRFGGDYADYMRALTGWIELKTPIDEGFRAAQRCRRAGKRLYCRAIIRARAICGCARNLRIDSASCSTAA